MASLAAEALSFIDANGDGDDSPIMEAKSPRELALLVKHYRLLQASAFPLYAEGVLLGGVVVLQQYDGPLASLPRRASLELG